MSKMITWSTSKYSASNTAHETDSLFYAEDVIRYWKFRSPLSIKFCLEEAVRYVVGKQDITVPPGSFYVVNDGTEMECLPNNPGVKALIVFFTDTLVSDVSRNRRFDDKKLLDNPAPIAAPEYFFEHIYRQPGQLTRQLQLLSRQMATATGPDHTLAPDLFYHLAENLFSLQQGVSRQISRVNARTPATRQELFRRVLRAKEFMQDYWNTELQLEQIAQVACLSPYHFHRSFREAFGQSPMKWLRQLKIQHAQSMLETGKLSVTQIAYRCGFADIYSFSKAFKRELGVPPTAVRAVL